MFSAAESFDPVPFFGIVGYTSRCGSGSQIEPVRPAARCTPSRQEPSASAST